MERHVGRSLQGELRVERKFHSSHLIMNYGIGKRDEKMLVKRFKPRIQKLTAAAGSVFDRRRQDSPEEEHSGALDRDASGNSLYKEDIIAYVKNELDRRKRDRLPLERQWTLNSNFLLGNQYCEINIHSGELEQVIPEHDWLSRETFNRIAPLMQVRRANLNKLSYDMKVTAQTNEFEDLEKAEVSSKILKHKQKSSDFEEQKNKLIAWSELTGTSFFMSWWNKDAGEEYARISELTEDGEKERVLFEGDVEYSVLTPYEVYPENIFKESVSEQRSIIIEQVKHVDEIYDLYGIRVSGKAVDTFSISHVTTNTDLARESTAMSLCHHTAENSEKIITYFEKKSRLYPDGRMIIIVGDTELVYYGKLPYKEIPIVKNISQSVQGMFFGRSVIEDLIPLQRAYNGCVNRIHEHIKRLGIGAMAIEEGSIDDIDELLDEGIPPGKIVPYKNGYNPPSALQIGGLPTEIMSERANLLSDMEYVAGMSQLSVAGSLPSGVTAATAIENLAAIDSTRLSLTADNARNAVKKLGKQWLSIYKLYASTERVINCVGLNSSGIALRWSKESITDYDVEFTTENELLLSEDMQKQRFTEAFQLGAFTDENGIVPQSVKNKLIEFSRVGNYSEIMNINTLQMQKAQRENAYFEEGVLPELSDFDDDVIHIEEHTRYVLQEKFDIFKRARPETAKEFENHINEHKKRKAAQAIKKMQLNGGM